MIIKTLYWFFWISVFFIFYTYLGYGIILYILVKIKEFFRKSKEAVLPKELPDITLLIAAYNEESIVKEKMLNCEALDYPKDKLHILWVTDGSSDRTNELLKTYPNVTIAYDPQRGGKTSALNRGISFVKTSLVIFNDANAMLNTGAIKEIVRLFNDDKVGCVSGEKRVFSTDAQGATAGEGIYWKYESTLKALDFRLYSAVGAAGELFAIRTHLYEIMPKDTLLDDFILSLRVAMKGYKIAYSSKAYAQEDASLNMIEEQKRKVRISAGGIQSIARLTPLLNIFKYDLLSFQYISHRVLRWTITPLLLFILLPINLILAYWGNDLYAWLLIPHILFYLMGWSGYQLDKKNIKNKLLYIPYYFLFMNVNVIKGFFFLRKNRGNGAWEKAKRR